MKRFSRVEVKQWKRQDKNTENHIHAAGLNAKPNQAERTNIFRSGRRRDATDSRGRNVMREVRDFFLKKKNAILL